MIGERLMSRIGAGEAIEAPSAPPRLSVGDLTAAYGAMQVLHGVTLHVDPGEAVAVLGANGAGKTTLLRRISGLLHPRAGHVEFAGVDITTASPAAILRAGLAHVPEGRQVFASMTVDENLLLGGRLRRDGAERVAADREYVFEVFPDLAAKLGQQAGELSGGQQQMLAIARALMARPALLVLDEPTLGLAPRLVDDLGDLLQTLRRDREMGLLLIEQDAFLALELTSRAYVMQRGEITLERRSSDLLDDPQIVFAYLGGDPQPQDVTTAAASPTADPTREEGLG